MKTKIIVIGNYLDIQAAEKYGYDAPEERNEWVDAWIDFNDVISANLTETLIDEKRELVIRVDLRNGSYRLLPFEKEVLDSLDKRFICG